MTQDCIASKIRIVSFKSSSSQPPFYLSLTYPQFLLYVSLLTIHCSYCLLCHIPLLPVCCAAGPCDPQPGCSVPFTFAHVTLFLLEVPALTQIGLMTSRFASTFSSSPLFSGQAILYLFSQMFTVTPKKALLAA